MNQKLFGGFFAFVSFVSLVSILSGCASSHRASKTTKTVEWFQDRQDGLVERITFLDKEAGGGVFLLTDPKVSAMSAIHTNQDAFRRRVDVQRRPIGDHR